MAILRRDEVLALIRWCKSSAVKNPFVAGITSRIVGDIVVTSAAFINVEKKSGSGLHEWQKPPPRDAPSPVKRAGFSLAHFLRLSPSADA